MQDQSNPFQTASWVFKNFKNFRKQRIKGFECEKNRQLFKLNTTYNTTVH